MKRQFLNGKQHGKGKYTLPNGYYYEGEWKEGKIEGLGVAKYPDGSSYQGNFVDGKHSGQGKLIFLMELFMKEIGCKENLMVKDFKIFKWYIS